MFKNILGTAGTNIATNVISFVILGWNANFLGKEGLGEVALIMLALNLIIQFSFFIGGSPLVFLVPRYPLMRLLLPSYIWAVAMSVSVPFVLAEMELLPERFTTDLIMIGLMFSIMQTHLNVLIGKEKIISYNIVNFAYFGVLITALAGIYWGMDERSVTGYVSALYYATTAGCLLSLMALMGEAEMIEERTGNPVKELARLSFYTQVANVSQLMNYRLSLYFLKVFQGDAAVGYFSAAISISEWIWKVPKSIALVQYSKIANTVDKAQSIALSVRFMWFSLVLALGALVFVFAVPESIYMAYLGDDFKGIKDIMWWLAPGVVLFSTAIMFSPYFSGTGKYHLNAIASLSGMVVTIVGGYLLIEEWKVEGAGIVTSLSYIVTTFVTFYFMFRDGMTGSDLKPRLK